MIIYGQDLEDKSCEFSQDLNTKKFLVSFFGFYSHNIEDDFKNFLKEIGIKDTIRNVEDYKEKFQLDGINALEAYNMYDRRTFDLSLILPKVFSSKDEAIGWFKNKIKESDYMKMSEIDEINVLDADKLLIFLEKLFNYENKIKSINKEINNKLAELKINLMKEYSSDPDYKRVIKDRFRDILR